MKNSDRCIYCGDTRGEIRLLKRVKGTHLPCITVSGRHQFIKPKRKKKLITPDNQLAFNLEYEDI